MPRYTQSSRFTLLPGVHSFDGQHEDAYLALSKHCLWRPWLELPGLQASGASDINVDHRQTAEVALVCLTS